VARLRKSEIELLWVQLEELIEQRQKQRMQKRASIDAKSLSAFAKTMPKNKPDKEAVSQAKLRRPQIRSVI